MTGVRALGAALATLFVVLGSLHVQWAFAGLPTRVPVIPSLPDGPLPVPSAASCLGVATALFLAAVVVLACADLILGSIPRWMMTVAGSVLGGVFVLRTVGDLRFFGLFKTVTETDFAFWDTALYTPLCLAIGIGTLTLVFLSRSRAAQPGPGERG